MTSYEVTLAMPVYNVSKYIKRALLSALNQTFESIEFLIIDDKGTDDSMDVVREIQSSHCRGKDIRIVEHPHNIGTGGTKNTAIREARGKYLYFMDSDDTIVPTSIQILYDKIVATNSDVVLASHQDIKEGRIIRKYILPDLYVEGDWAVLHWMEKSHLLYLVPTWNKLYRLSLLRNNEVTCIPHHRNEDTVFTFKTVFCLKKIVSIPDILYNYHYNSNSAVHKSINAFYYTQYLEIFEERIKKVETFSGTIPPMLYLYMYEPFYYSFLPKVLLSKLSFHDKILFLSKLSMRNKINIVDNSSLFAKDFKFIHSLVYHQRIYILTTYYLARLFLMKLHIL